MTRYAVERRSIDPMRNGMDKPSSELSCQGIELVRKAMAWLRIERNRTAMEQLVLDMSSNGKAKRTVA